jgi:hypothetical protein
VRRQGWRRRQLGFVRRLQGSEPEDVVQPFPLPLFLLVALGFLQRTEERRLLVVVLGEVGGGFCLDDGLRLLIVVAAAVVVIGEDGEIGVRDPRLEVATEVARPPRLVLPLEELLPEGVAEVRAIRPQRRREVLDALALLHVEHRP